MNNTIELILSFIAAYIVGSLPFAQIFTSIFAHGKKLKNEGTGNVGTENAWIVAGPVAGLLTGLFDFSKGALVLTGAHLILGWSFQTELVKLMCLSLFVIIGHDYPVWLKFRGGSGFAVITSTLLYLSFASWLCGTILLFITLAIRDTPKKIAAQHLFAGTSIVVTAVMFLIQNGKGWEIFFYSIPYFLGQPISSNITLFVFTIFFVILYGFQRSRHKGLLSDLKSGINPWRAIYLRVIFEIYPAESSWKGPNPEKLLLTDEMVFGQRKRQS